MAVGDHAVSYVDHDIQTVVDQQHIDAQATVFVHALWLGSKPRPCGTFGGGCNASGFAIIPSRSTTKARSARAWGHGLRELDTGSKTGSNTKVRRKHETNLTGEAVTLAAQFRRQCVGSVQEVA